MFFRKNKGFSLIEIMLALAITFILAVSAYTIYNKVQTENKVNKMLSIIDVLRSQSKDLNGIVGAKNVDFDSLKSYVNSSNHNLIEEDGKIASLQGARVYYLSLDNTSNLYVSLPSINVDVCVSLYNKITARYGSVLVADQDKATRLNIAEIANYCNGDFDGSYVLINSYNDT